MNFLTNSSSLEESAEQFIPDKIRQENDPDGHVEPLFKLRSPEIIKSEMDDPLALGENVDKQIGLRKSSRRKSLVVSKHSQEMIGKINLRVKNEEENPNPTRSSSCPRVLRRRFPRIQEQPNFQEEGKIPSKFESKKRKLICTKDKDDNSISASANANENNSIVPTIQNLLAEICKDDCNVCQELILRLSQHVTDVHQSVVTNSENENIGTFNDFSDSDSAEFVPPAHTIDSPHDEDGQVDSELKFKSEVKSQSPTRKRHCISNQRRKRKQKGTKRIRCPLCAKVLFPIQLDEHLKSHSTFNPPLTQGTDPAVTEELKTRVQEQVMEKVLEGIQTGTGQSRSNKNKDENNEAEADVIIESQNNSAKFVKTKTKTFISCEICNARFVLSKNLDKHMKDVHDPNKFNFVCNECGYVFKSVNMLGRHFRASHPNKFPFVCSVCNKGFLRMADLKAHVAQSHLKQRKFSCGFEGCGKTFCMKNNMEAHMKRAHTNSKTHCCDTCGKSYSSLFDLNIHSLHHQEKKFKCDECAKCFLTKYKLDRHKLIHTGDKPHVCDQCGKSFRQKGVLTNHYKLHTGERPHKCTVCGKGYILPENLRYHTKTQHPS